VSMNRRVSTTQKCGPPPSLLRSAGLLPALLWPFVLSHFPSLVGIIGIHGLKGLEGIRPEILLIHNATRADHECFYPRNLIFGRRGHKAEPTDHCASDDEIYFTSGRGRALLRQHFEVVTVIRLTLFGIALRESIGHLFANRAGPGSIRIFPGQTIVLSRRADDLLRILIYFGVIMFLLRIFFLRIIEPATDRDCIEFIRANAAVQNFFLANLCIAYPLTLSFYDRNRQREVILPDFHNGVVALLFERTLFLCLLRKCNRAVLVLHGIFRSDKVVALGPEDFLQRSLIE